MGSVEKEVFRCCGQISTPFIPRVKTTGNNDHGEELALDTRSLWPNGSILTVKIIGASDFVKSKIQQFANVWSEFANLTFSFIDNGDTDIRVFVVPGGSWSYIGTGSKGVPQDQPTMNFGWFNDQTADDEFSRVVIHEFGHAIGCIHEQASPVANIPWNKPVVYEYYLKNDGWNQAQVDSNVFAVADQANTIETTFDRRSIMEYPIDPSWTLDGSSAGWNLVLSDQDKTFIMQRYPKTGIVRTTNDGVYLVNCFKGDQISSGIAYYSFLGNNDGQQPTAYIDIAKGSNVTWEGSLGSGTFPDGNVVRWSIVANAGSLATYSNVGIASNLEEHWNVYKDKYRLLYEVDGWQCYTVYWCF
ncbi:hypothetical protein BKA65DRAFT_246865 [Rhexocercosporidium sp. MPI-PUGE-AT-0058]|nr:hypothetical protein BKA65DRAFT_246865 [Rhexocercosporidium sp. MPI-PUGE-AT-0058]